MDSRKIEAQLAWQATAHKVNAACHEWIAKVRERGFAGYHQIQNGFFPWEHNRIYFCFDSPLGWYSGGMFKPLEVGDLIAVCDDYNDEGVIRITKVHTEDRGEWEWVRKMRDYKTLKDRVKELFAWL